MKMMFRAPLLPCGSMNASTLGTGPAHPVPKAGHGPTQRENVACQTVRSHPLPLSTNVRRNGDVIRVTATTCAKMQDYAQVNSTRKGENPYEAALFLGGLPNRRGGTGRDGDCHSRRSWADHHSSGIE